MPRNYQRKAPDRCVVTKEQLETAKKLIANGTTKRKAASQVGLSESALRRRLKLGKAAESLGRYLPTFSKAQEGEIYRYLKKSNDRYGFTMNSLRKFIYEYAEINNITHRFNKFSKLAGRDWVYGVMKRFPELKLGQPTPTSIAGAMRSNKAQRENASDSDSEDEEAASEHSEVSQKSAGSQQVAGASVKTSEEPPATNLMDLQDDKTTIQVIADEEADEAELRNLNEQALNITLTRIQANPQLYIGIPKNCYHLINILQTQTQIPTEHILLCLKKVKLDTHFDELADQFGIKAYEAIDIFMKNIPILSNILQSFINSDSEDTNNMPTLYRKYHSTTIIETLELNVQPVSAKSEALTQTEQGNTVKYIVCCSPEGFINYVSPGYGGRQSYEALLENTNLLERFKPGASIIANGFRNVDHLVANKGLQLLKSKAQGRDNQNGTQNEQDSMSNYSDTDNVYSAEERDDDNDYSVSYKPKEELDIVVQRVREFTLVKDRTFISPELLRVLDDAVVISCALINLQSFTVN